MTEIVQLPDRGHSLTIDHGWREVARTALAFVERSLDRDGAPTGEGLHRGDPTAPQRRTDP